MSDSRESYNISLARKIEKYWLDRGFMVDTTVYEMNARMADHGKTTEYGIWSDMRDGLPSGHPALR